MRIGIIGGGQLGRMFIQNGLNYGLEFHVMDPDPGAPCSAIAHRFVCAPLNDAEAVYDLGKACDVVTIEIENVSVEGLKRLRDSGVRVYPQPEIVEMIRDKGMQKEFYRAHHLPTSDFVLARNHLELENHTGMLPVMQKLRVGGYDGKGVRPLRTSMDFAHAFDAPSVLEAWVDFALELSVLVARNESGQVKSFPLVELVFNPEANLVDYLVSPARVEPRVEQEARLMAEKLITDLNMVGLLAVEMFLTRDGRVLINEMAPRPHNSGHHTIEACFSSQFDQHLRAILNWPLGDTSLRCAAAMSNLIGEKGYEGQVVYEGLEEVVRESGAYPHLYGKTTTKAFRKMGHITFLAPTREEALAKAALFGPRVRVKA